MLSTQLLPVIETSAKEGAVKPSTKNIVVTAAIPLFMVLVLLIIVRPPFLVWLMMYDRNRNGQHP